MLPARAPVSAAPRDSPPDSPRDSGERKVHGDDAFGSSTRAGAKEAGKGAAEGCSGCNAAACLAERCGRRKDAYRGPLVASVDASSGVAAAAVKGASLASCDRMSEGVVRGSRPRSAAESTTSMPSAPLPLSLGPAVAETMPPLTRATRSPLSPPTAAKPSSKASAARSAAPLGAIYAAVDSDIESSDQGEWGHGIHENDVGKCKKRSPRQITSREVTSSRDLVNVESRPGLGGIARVGAV
jgi:hypothetical protein